MTTPAGNGKMGAGKDVKTLDIERIGSFIRELRKEKDLTQKELADALHITDRAVSKWERGLNAPDIALLEPLSKILGVTVGELIRGQREGEPQMDETKSLLDYSKSEIARKVRGERKRYAAILALVLLLAGALLWRSGIFFLLDKKVSPDGQSVVRIYSRERTSWPLRFTTRRAVQIVESRNPGGGCYLDDCEYKGLWWTPDSWHYLLELNWQGEQCFFLDGHTNLKPLLNNLGLYLKEEGYLQYDERVINSLTEYQFLQWGKDSESMLFYYSCETNLTKKQGKPREGYFWYNRCENKISGVVEIQVPIYVSLAAP